MKTIIGISGQINAGKTATSKILSESLGVPYYSFSNLIESLLLNNGVEITRHTLQNKGIEIINQIGYSGIASLLLETYSINLNEPCIIEGIRHIDVCNFYRNKFQNKFKLIYIDCSREIRFERIRGKIMKNIIINSIEDFINIENHIVETEIEKIKENADFIIDNSLTLENLSFSLSKLNFE